MIGLALSGGGSRAMAFHLGCLRALDDLGLLDQIRVLSTISGGSVIGAYYAYTPHRSFQMFEADIRRFLRQGFHRSIAFELAKPANLFHCAGNLLGTKMDAVGCWLQGTQPQLRRFPSRTDMFRNVLQRDVFSDVFMSSPRRVNLEVIIGACELRTGTAFRFGDKKSGNHRFGEMLQTEIDVSLAVAASAAYPIFLPALDRTWKFIKKGSESKHRVLLTDGGVYDNLGVQVLEPGRDSNFSLHTVDCEYIIACNAGQGQESGDSCPIAFLPRVSKSFGIVHRKVQDGLPPI